MDTSAATPASQAPASLAPDDQGLLHLWFTSDDPITAICVEHNLSLRQIAAWAKRPDIAEIIATLRELHEERAKLQLTLAAHEAIITLKVITTTESPTNAQEFARRAAEGILSRCHHLRPKWSRVVVNNLPATPPPTPTPPNTPAIKVGSAGPITMASLNHDASQLQVSLRSARAAKHTTSNHELRAAACGGQAPTVATIQRPSGTQANVHAGGISINTSNTLDTNSCDNPRHDLPRRPAAERDFPLASVQPHTSRTLSPASPPQRCQQNRPRDRRKAASPVIAFSSPAPPGGAESERHHTKATRPRQSQPRMKLPSG